MKMPDESLAFTRREEWRAWLEEHHDTAKEAWLLHYKKKAAKPWITYEEAVEEALCFGWIDGLLKAIDGETYALRFSPRQRKSIWSESNKRRVAKLFSEGRMTPAGLARIADAKQNGEWEAATAREDVDAIPEDLARELGRNKAWASFENWPASRKKQYLHWLNSAKRSETRQKRLRAIVEMATTGE